MKLLNVLLLFSFLFTGTDYLFAQETEKPAGENQHLTSNYFDFYFINGYAVAYRFSANENSALRLQLDFSRSFSDANTEGTNTYTQNSSPATSQSTTGDSKSSSINLSLFFQYTYNIYKSDKGHAYVGAGPFLSYSKFTNESNSSYGNTNTQPVSNTQSNYHLNRSIGLGIGLLIGIEGYLTKNINVFAETHITGGKSWSKNEYNSTSNYIYTNSQSVTRSEYNLNDNAWYYNLTSIRIGIGISI